jgi:hypothetical protein
VIISVSLGLTTVLRYPNTWLLRRPDLLSTL